MLVLVTAFLYPSDVATLLYFICIIVHATLLELNDDDDDNDNLIAYMVLFVCYT